eukprot:snap_masked-scaffold_10-processed-gene-8.10-mRNA-1 protein AED:1.00 eAED:1.00 QI:0/-1/0/0/-1/1/1/0/92
MLSIQSIGIFHGLWFEVKVAELILEGISGITSFYKNLHGKFNMLQEKNKILGQLKSLVCTEVEAESITIPYFRRNSNLRLLGLIQQELSTEE